MIDNLERSAQFVRIQLYIDCALAHLIMDIEILVIKLAMRPTELELHWHRRIFSVSVEINQQMLYERPTKDTKARYVET